MATPKRIRQFDAQAFLDSSGVARKSIDFRPNAVIYRQGDPADAVMYLQKGRVKLSVISNAGKEAVVGRARARAISSARAASRVKLVRMGTATAMVATTVLVDREEEDGRGCSTSSPRCRIGSSPTCSRGTSASKKTSSISCSIPARSGSRGLLLLLARYGKQDDTQRVIPKMSQEMLAEMVGTTRSRVNFFMNKFRKLGIHRVQRRPEDQQLAHERRPARVTPSCR